jgi:hypothetical protein
MSFQGFLIDPRFVDDVSSGSVSGGALILIIFPQEGGELSITFHETQLYEVWKSNVFTCWTYAGVNGGNCRKSNQVAMIRLEQAIPYHRPQHNI